MDFILNRLFCSIVRRRIGLDVRHQILHAVILFAINVWGDEPAIIHQGGCESGIFIYRLLLIQFFLSLPSPSALFHPRCCPADHAADKPAPHENLGFLGSVGRRSRAPSYLKGSKLSLITSANAAKISSKLLILLFGGPGRTR